MVEFLTRQKILNLRKRLEAPSRDGKPVRLWSLLGEDRLRLTVDEPPKTAGAPEDALSAPQSGTARR
jgi:hypothetical protein